MLLIKKTVDAYLKGAKIEETLVGRMRASALKRFGLRASQIDVKKDFGSLYIYHRGLTK